MWGRVRLAEREDGGGGGHKDEEIGDGASEGGEGEGGRVPAGGAGGAAGAGGVKGPGGDLWKGSDLPPHQEMGQLSVQVTTLLNYPCCGVGGDGVNGGGEEMIFENTGEKVPTCCGKGRCCFYTKVRLFSFSKYLLNRLIHLIYVALMFYICLCHRTNTKVMTEQSAKVPLGFLLWLQK